MGMPPQDCTPAELFKRLVDCPRPSKVVAFPRNDPVSGKPLAQVRLMSLTDGEIEEARADGLAATRRLIERKKADGLKPEDITLETMRGIETDAIARYILMKAVRWPNPISGQESNPTGKQYIYVFHEPSDFEAAQMTNDEIAVLYTQWEVHQHESGPLYTGPMGEEEVTAWIEKLAEGAGSFPLSRISLPQLIDLTYSCARRAYTLAAVLASHSESLPSGLAADLESWGIGKSFSGKLPAEAAMIGLVSSSSSNDEGEPVPRRVISAKDLPAVLNLGAEPLSDEQAIALARKLGRGGIGSVTVGEALEREPDDDE